MLNRFFNISPGHRAGFSLPHDPPHPRTHNQLYLF
nr:MAG TPA: hypothetical protein [Caudoviricetes sp.]